MLQGYRVYLSSSDVCSSEFGLCQRVIDVGIELAGVGSCGVVWGQQRSETGLFQSSLSGEMTVL